MWEINMIALSTMEAEKLHDQGQAHVIEQSKAMLKENERLQLALVLVQESDFLRTEFIALLKRKKGRKRTVTPKMFAKRLEVILGQKFNMANSSKMRPRHDAMDHIH